RPCLGQQARLGQRGHGPFRPRRYHRSNRAHQHLGRLRGRLGYLKYLHRAAPDRLNDALHTVLHIPAVPPRVRRQHVLTRTGSPASIRQVSTGATEVAWKPVATMPGSTPSRSGPDAVMLTGKSPAAVLTT